uniref:RING-type E3 ubiquitin transferase n=1 Tax=Zea mays TaxID=4577 RepID=A0A804MWN0_MAIZE
MDAAAAAAAQMERHSSAAAQMERHSSAAAFVEGGVQDGCDDTCSICLETFSDSDPSAVTSCKHEFHLQCILEWCQRSSQCPMCWQAISMKDPTSQELLEAVEEERNDVQENHARTTTVFRHPLLGDFEVPVDADDAEIEERIMQHLAAAAAIRRSHRHARREGRRSSRAAAAHGHGHPQPQTQVLFFPSAGEATPGGSGSPSPHPRQEHAASSVVSPPPLPAVASAEGTDADSTASVGGAVGPDDRSQSSPVNHDEAGPSADAQSFSDTIKSRLQSVSTKYKDSITKSTRGWKERWFAQSSAMSNLGSEMRREVGAGIAAVSRMIEKQLETRPDGSGTAPSPATASSPAHAHPGSDASSQGQGAAVPATPAAALNNATPAAAAALNDASSSSTA